MIGQLKGKIFLCSERGHTESDAHRSYQTFSFGAYQNPNKAPFQNVYIWNDDTLAGGKSFTFLAEDESLLFLLPVVGAVRCSDGLGQEFLVEAGQSLFCWVKKGTTVEISNPYQDSLVNFLQGWFKTTSALACSVSTAFSLDENKNSLIELTPPITELKAFVGKFDGRSEGSLSLAQNHSHVFVFVIQGAFEVQNRLLESRDALALWNLQEVEFEALSNEAILLLIAMT